MFRESGEAPARAASVASVLQDAGHQVARRAVSGSWAALREVISGSPEVIHACGSNVWPAAGTTARILRTVVVYEALGEWTPELPNAERTARGASLARGAGAVIANTDAQAGEIRSDLGLPYLPPVIGRFGAGTGEADAADVLTALYDRLPRLNPQLHKGDGAPADRRERLLHELLEPVRRGAMRRPLALFAYLRGRRLRASGRSQEAASALERARNGDPHNAIYALYLARAFREAGAPDGAAEVLRALASGVGERDIWVLGEIGVEFARLSSTAEARNAGLKLRTIGDDGEAASADALARAAQVSAALGDMGEGRELASRGAALAPDGSRAQRLAAQVLEHVGEPSAALELARRSRVAGQERRLSGLLRTLEPGWAPRLTGIRGIDPAADRRVLNLLEVSLPHAPSGYAYRSRDLLVALREAGFDPVVATRLGFPASRGIVNYSPVESVDREIHHRYGFPGLRQYSGIPLDRQVEVNARCLLRLVERIRPSLLLAGTPNLNGAVALALRSAVGSAVVYDVRGFPEMSWATQPGGSESELYRRRRDAETGCAAAADAVITLSETMKAELVGRGLGPDHVHTVPHVVDTERYSPQPRNEELARSYGIDGDKLTIGCVTTLTAYEGIDTVLRAVAQLRREHPDVVALLVGDGPARASLEALTANLGIEENVVFTGRIPQARAPEHYALLDLFLLTRPDLEVCRAVTPLKPFEALAMGVPVIASDLPALAEVISASGAGRLVEPGSHGALAAAILELVDDRAARERLGVSGRRYAVGHHNPAAATAAIGAALASL